MKFYIWAWDDRARCTRIFVFDETSVTQSKDGRINGEQISPRIFAHGKPSNKIYLLESWCYRTYFRDYESAGVAQMGGRIFRWLDRHHRLERIKDTISLFRVHGIDFNTLKKVSALSMKPARNKLTDANLDELYARVVLEEI